MKEISQSLMTAMNGGKYTIYHVYPEISLYSGLN